MGTAWDHREPGIGLGFDGPLERPFTPYTRPLSRSLDLHPLQPRLTILTETRPVPWAGTRLDLQPAGTY